MLAAAEAIGYRPNRVASALLTGRSAIVGVVVGGLFNPFHAMALEAFGRALQAAGRQAMLIQVDDEHSLGEAVGQLAGYQLDAVLTSLPVLTDDTAQALSRFEIPIVTLAPALTGGWVRSVVPDNAGLGTRAAVLLHDRGARRLAYVAGAADNPVQRLREAGFRLGLANLGLDLYAWAEGDHDHAGGYLAIQSMFERGPTPDALFCFNDLTALGAIDALKAEFGLRCPDDVLVVGCDDIPAAAWPSYRLTTFAPDLDDMVAQALALIRDGTDRPTPEIIVASRLVERESTAAI